MNVSEESASSHFRAALCSITTNKFYLPGPGDREGVTWEGVTWERVTWEEVTWEGVTWERVTWGGVTWERVTWEDRENCIKGSYTVCTDTKYYSGIRLKKNGMGGPCSTHNGTRETSIYPLENVTEKDNATPPPNPLPTRPPFYILLTYSMVQTPS